MKRLVVILALGLFMIALITPVSAQFGSVPTQNVVETTPVLPAGTEAEAPTNAAVEQRAQQRPNFGPPPAERMEERTQQRQENREERQDTRQENRQERQDTRQENRDDRQENRQENRAERWKEAAERLQNRLRWFDQRLADIFNRATQRLGILKGNGVDVTAAESSLDTAEQLMDDARADAAQAVELMAALDPTADGQNGSLAEVRTAVETAHESYGAVRKELLNAVRLMKQARGITTQGGEQ